MQNEYKPAAFKIQWEGTSRVAHNKIQREEEGRPQCRGISINNFFFFFFFGLFVVVVVVAISWAAPAAYGGSQARG